MYWKSQSYIDTNKKVYSFHDNVTYDLYLEERCIFKQAPAKQVYEYIINNVKDNDVFECFFDPATVIGTITSNMLSGVSIKKEAKRFLNNMNKQAEQQRSQL